MNRLLFFACGLVCGLALTTLYSPKREVNHVSKTQRPTEPPIPLLRASAQSPAAARIVVETIAERPTQADVLKKIANFKSAEQIIWETNQAAREYVNGHRS